MEYVQCSLSLVICYLLEFMRCHTCEEFPTTAALESFIAGSPPTVTAPTADVDLLGNGCPRR